jgi:hypothetical protein
MVSIPVLIEFAGVVAWVESATGDDVRDREAGGRAVLVIVGREFLMKRPDASKQG